MHGRIYFNSNESTMHQINMHDHTYLFNKIKSDYKS